MMAIMKINLHASCQSSCVVKWANICNWYYLCRSLTLLMYCEAKPSLIQVSVELILSILFVSLLFGSLQPWKFF
jgi:hypothetical protein